MADIDLDRLAALRTRFGKPAKRNRADWTSMGAQFKAQSRGLAAASADARRARTLGASAGGPSLRKSLASMVRRSSRN